MSEDSGHNFKLMLVVMVLLSLLIAAGTSYFMLQQLGGNSQSSSQASESVAELGPTHKAGEFTVNLSDNRRYLRMNLVLEVSNKDVINKLETRNPQVRDAVISIVRTKKPQDINTQAGIKDLREQIRNELNKFIAEGKVTNVFFTQFVVQ
ncbi:flagellar basal body-associated FliL family protein [Acetohalobium arabaticum]|uniref:Flagellar protein FliL n=1 Tax=Acetohalobium arabaticum (strain ATCC 49924 / DSM 5501 / Z-7288) TaxID=574087 RepID=D9QRJ7_ACEAZ|nr:flagellar basal body-associated FliL family protein [Acetohalobium arabaticum]ADL13138.1 flagellar basal body-associated protein FliL [Acetohalobium arabaticum DSM 5501]